MKPLYQGLAVGILVALAHAIVLNRGWTLWDVSMVSISSLSAGVLFILGMIFQSTLQDYKKANIAITRCRGNILSMQDINIIAAAEEETYDPRAFRATLAGCAASLGAFIDNDVPPEETMAAIAALIPASAQLRRALPGAQANLFLNQHGDLRQSFSYLAFLKDHNFPGVGYVFLSFFAAFIIGLQIFSATQNVLLDTLFIFSLSSVLVFFIAFIRDLDFPFRCHLACFTLDTQPLHDTAASLQKTTTQLMPVHTHESRTLTGIVALENYLQRMAHKKEQRCRSTLPAHTTQGDGSCLHSTPCATYPAILPQNSVL